MRLIYEVATDSAQSTGKFEKLLNSPFYITGTKGKKFKPLPRPFSLSKRIPGEKQILYLLTLDLYLCLFVKLYVDALFLISLCWFYDWICKYVWKYESMYVSMYERDAQLISSVPPEPSFETLYEY